MNRPAHTWNGGVGRLGRLLVRSRLKLGRSQDWMATKLDCSRGAVVHMENGRRALSVHRLRRVARLYGVEVDQVLRAIEYDAKGKP